MKAPKLLQLKKNKLYKKMKKIKMGARIAKFLKKKKIQKRLN